MDIELVRLKDKFDLFTDFWNPKIIGKLNGQLIKAAKFKGEFIEHLHEDEDEMFLVIEGALIMETENKTLEINPGEFIIIPKGLKHKPIAAKEVKVLLFEPESTLNTGETENQLTQKKLDYI